MKCVYCLSVYCALLSVWGIIQLYLMAIFYFIEAGTMVHDAMEKHTGGELEVYDYDKFKKLVKDSYRKLALKCTVAGTFYVVILIVCLISLRIHKKKDAKQRLLENDIEYICSKTQKHDLEENMSKEDKKRRNKELKQIKKQMPKKQKDQKKRRSSRPDDVKLRI